MDADQSVASAVRYRRVRSLGRGGFGEVWLANAEDGVTRPYPVAMKVLHAHVAATPGIEERLRDEARLGRILGGSGLVGVREVLRLPDGRLAVVLDYVEGDDLHALAAAPIPPRVVAELGAGIARLLARLHGAKDPLTGEPLEIVHRDVKPANVRIGADGRLFLMDLGIARARFPEREAHTRHVIGTPGYIAPERMFGKEGPYGDVYSLGVTLFALGGLGEPLTDPERLAAWRAASVLPAPLVEVLDDLLDRDCTRRPTAAEAADRLEAVAAGIDGPDVESWRRLPRGTPVVASGTWVPEPPPGGPDVAPHAAPQPAAVPSGVVLGAAREPVPAALGPAVAVPPSAATVPVPEAPEAAELVAPRRRDLRLAVATLAGLVGALLVATSVFPGAPSSPAAPQGAPGGTADVATFDEPGSSEVPVPAAERAGGRVEPATAEPPPASSARGVGAEQSKSVEAGPPAAPGGPAAEPPPAEAAPQASGATPGRAGEEAPNGACAAGEAWLAVVGLDECTVAYKAAKQEDVSLPGCVPTGVGTVTATCGSTSFSEPLHVAGPATFTCVGHRPADCSLGR